MIKGFRQWLIENNVYSTPKQVTDCVSRVRTVEKAFSAYGIDLDQEFNKNGCKLMLRCVTREGHAPERKEFPDLKLPYDSSNRQMSAIANALKKYVLFRSITENSFSDEFEPGGTMNRIYSNYKDKHTH